MIGKNNKIDQSYFWLNQPIYEIRNHKLYIYQHLQILIFGKKLIMDLKGIMGTVY